MTHNQQRTKWYKEGAYALLTGVLYGSTSILVGHPFDTIKTKMQAQSGYITHGGFIYSSRKAIRTDGFRGLYSGWLPPLWGSSVYRALQFAVFEALYTKWDSESMRQEIPLSGGVQVRVLSAGLVASTCRAIVESPIEYAKVRRQTAQLWALRDVYTGFGVQWARTCGLMTFYLVAVDAARRRTPEIFDRWWGAFAVSGGAATLGFWLVWPFETIKNQVQAQTQGVGTTWRSRMQYIMAHHGPTGLFRGIVPGTASIFLRNGAAMVVMQAAQKQLTKLGLREAPPLKTVSARPRP